MPDNRLARIGAPGCSEHPPGWGKRATFDADVTWHRITTLPCRVKAPGQWSIPSNESIFAFMSVSLLLARGVSVSIGLLP